MIEVKKLPEGQYSIPCEVKDMRPWIGVDLDGTLAEYYGWISDGSIGKPVPLMVKRVVGWVKNGMLVKIFTARAADPAQIPRIKQWLFDHGLPDLEVTNVKDMACKQIWDDRAIGVKRNEGIPLCVCMDPDIV